MLAKKVSKSPPNSPKKKKTPTRSTASPKKTKLKPKTKSKSKSKPISKLNSPLKPAKAIVGSSHPVNSATTIVTSRKRTTGTRAQVSRGSAAKTSGGLTKDGLIRGADGRLKSRAVSEQAKYRYLNPKSDSQKVATKALKNQASAVSQAFAAVREIKGDKKIDARRVIKDVGKGVFTNPKDYLY